MPKKSSGSKIVKVSPKMIGMGVVVAVVVAVGGAAVYAKMNNKPLAIQMGDNGFGVWFDPNTGQPHVEAGEFGCCMPYCADAFEVECSGEYGVNGIEG